MPKDYSFLKRFFSVLFTDRDIVDSEVPPTTPEPSVEPLGDDLSDISHPHDWDTPEDASSVTNTQNNAQKVEENSVQTPKKAEKPKKLRDFLIEKWNFWEEPSPAIAPITQLGRKWPEKKKENNSKNLNPDSALFLGNTLEQESVQVTTENLKRHMLVVGMTGSGKTTMLERMILQDIDAGRGIGLIDPHGDLYDKILHQIPKSRSNDVVLFDLTDIEYPIGFNILENTHHQFPSLIASSIVGVFKKIFGYSWGPRLEYILRNATLTLLEHDWSTLLDLTLLLTDEDYRRTYLANIKNPFLKKFWADEFESLSTTKQSEVVSPILNKVGQFLSVPLIRNIVSQPQSGFSPRWIMDNKKIFLANLSKGKIGEDVSEMLWSLLVSKFQLDVMSRASIEPDKREPFRLYVDEFQNFATDSFSDIFSEARKYGLSLVIAHQYMNQVSDQLMDAILGNVGNMAVFHVGSSDAKLLAPNIDSSLTPQTLVEQPLYNFVLKTTKNGHKHISQWELVAPETLPARSGLQNPEKLQTLVREKFAKDRKFVEGKLNIKMS